MDSFDKDQAIKEYLGISGSPANLSISGPNQIPGIIGDITSFSGKNMRIEVIRSSDKQDLKLPFIRFTKGSWIWVIK
ncbi:MAG: hypothetical protein AAE987_03385 [Thermoplasmataceae archaeon]|jgi:hypothetical protein